MLQSLGKYGHAVCVWFALLTGEAAGQTGVILGRTLDFGSESGVTVAEIELLDVQGRRVASTRADSSAVFRFDVVRAGTYKLRARASGYRDVITPEIQVPAGELMNIIVRLSPDVVPLAPLEVVARATSARGSLAFTNFLARSQRKSGGTFIMRDEIEARNPHQVSDLLYTVGSMTVMPETLINARGRCAPVIYLDGKRISSIQPNPREAYEIVNFMRPAFLQGVEVYAGAATVPAEFGGSNARCGVIAIWTRRGL